MNFKSVLANFIFLIGTYGISAQTDSTNQVVKYMGENLTVPKGCVVKHPTAEFNGKDISKGRNFSITCGLEFVHVSYYDAHPDELRYELENAYLEAMKNHFGDVKQSDLKCQSLGQYFSRAYLLAHKQDNKKRFKIIAYGIINDQYIQVYVGLLKKPKSNADLPEFIKQVIALK